MKGFKKDGKFRPTGNKSKSSLKKSDITTRYKKSSKDEPNYLKKKPDFCSGKHKCPICKKTKKCTGGAFGHDTTEGQGVCHAKGEECFCEDCEENRWDEVLEYHRKEGVDIPRNKKSVEPYGEYDTLTYEQQEEELKDYFKSFDYDLIKSLFEKPDSRMASPDVSEVKLSEFDPDEVDHVGDKIVSVMYVGTQNHIYGDQLAGQSGEIKDEVFNEYMFGKGNDIIRKQLGDDYSWYVRDEDVFIVKGLDD